MFIKILSLVYNIGVVMSLGLPNTSKASVNIIAWWGYFNKELVSFLEDKCKTKVSYDEYYTTHEFIKRMNEQSYSIAIFAQTGYNFIAKKANNKGVSLEEIKKTQHPLISQSIFNQNLPKNVAIFALEAAGFLYNADKISIARTDSLQEIFRKAKGKKVIVIDNPIEPMKFISPNYQFPSNINAKFQDLFADVEIIVSNDLANFSNDKDIVLAQAWLGNAYAQIKNNPKLKFIHHPAISYLGADLIAALNTKTETECVVKALAGKEINTKIVSNDFRLSPYGILTKNKNIASDLYLEVNNYFFKNTLQNLQWTTRPTEEEYLKIIKLWERTKLDLLSKN
ncbi:hypothetical protein ACWNT8_05530 [Pigmentibacter ruber]